MHKIQNKNKQNQTNTTQKTIKISNEPKMGVTPGVHEESLLYFYYSGVRIYHIKEFITFYFIIDLPWKGLGLLCDFIIALISSSLLSIICT
jgi:hypothetical protein